MKKYLIAGAILLTLSVSTTFAADLDWTPAQKADQSSVNQTIFKSYKNYSTLPTLGILSPTVIEVDFNADQITKNYFGVYNETLKQFVPSAFVSKEQVGPRITLMQDVATSANLYALFDKNQQTKYDFYLKNDSVTGADILIMYNSPIRTNSVTLTLDANVALPNTVSVYATINNSNVTLVSKVRPTSGTIKFPETTATNWRIYIEYSQPLRLTEVGFTDLSNIISKKSVRFLAIPGNTYVVYSNQEAYTPNYADTQESANLSGSAGVRNIGTAVLSANPAYVPSDVDGDSISDSTDNCVNVSNRDQIDINANAVGDVCDDFDKDNIINSVDNCPEVPNYNQKDTDGDKVGDTCDPDESRLTEKYPFIVWFGIGFAGLVFLALLFVAGNRIRNNQNTDVPPQVPPLAPPSIN